MTFESLLQEVQQLNNVSARLEALAPQHPSVENQLLAIAGSIRNSATLLKVLIVIREG
jgi:hypothetical protein